MICMPPVKPVSDPARVFTYFAAPSAARLQISRCDATARARFSVRHPEIRGLHRLPLLTWAATDLGDQLYTSEPSIAPEPSSKRTTPLNSTLWNSQGALIPQEPPDLIVRSPQPVHEPLAVTVCSMALSSAIVHSITSALSVVVQSQRHHQCRCGFTWISTPCCLKKIEIGHDVL